MGFLRNKSQEITLAMLEVCKEISAIKIFDISQDDMVKTRKLQEARSARGDTVVGTRSSHHFVPLSTSRIGHKLCSEDELFIDTHDFDLPTILDAADISPMQYVTCIHDSAWWVGMVKTVELGDSYQGPIYDFQTGVANCIFCL